jgi:type II secretory pathway component GspD/PulD (secretin)
MFSHIRSAVWYSIALMVILCSPGWAQTQPDVAKNEQNEQINLDRKVNSNTDTFKILRSGNKAETNNYVTKVYRLKYANPYELLPYVRKMIEAEKGTYATAFSPGPDGQPRSWVEISVPQFLLPYIDDAMAQLDVPDFKSSPGDIRINYRTQHRSAQEVADFIRVSDLSPDGKIVADPVTNTVFLADSPSDFKRVISTLQFYDVPTPEIDLETWVVEINDLDQTKLGLDWDAWKNSLGGHLDLAADSDRVKMANGEVVRTSGRSYDSLLSLHATTLANFLNYLVDKGKGRTVIDTHLRVTNGQTGNLNALTEVPEYAYLTDGDKKTLNEVLDSPTNQKFEGLKIKIQPEIAMNCTRLKIDLNLRTPVAIGKVGNPIYAERTLNTDLEVASGDLYRVGRLTRNVSAKENKGIPGLRSVPGLRWLFSSEETLLRESDVYVFVRPTWVAPAVSAVMALSGTEALKQFPYKVENILKANPNIQINAEDQAVLQQYFDEKFKAYQKERPNACAPAEPAPTIQQFAK